MHLVVIPDLHHAPNLAQLEMRIALEAPDKIIFLGDYFDQYGDTPETAAEMATWLAASMAQPNRIHLLGNHDLPYAWPGANAARCPGYNEAKRDAIHAVIPRETLATLPFYHWHDDLLFSHAGLSRRLLPPALAAGNVVEWLAAQAFAARTALDLNKSHPLLAIGQARGGPASAHGGLFWCDLSEFQPVAGIHQIFGHTPREQISTLHKPESCNWCIDTGTKKGVRHYARIQERTVTVHTLDGVEHSPLWNRTRATLPAQTWVAEAAPLNMSAPPARPGAAQLLHVSDLHGNQEWFEWVARTATQLGCAVAISGDLINVDAKSDARDLDRQTKWVRAWVRAARFPLFLSSGNHDLVFDETGQWVRDLAWPGVTVDGCTGSYAGRKIACLPYITGPDDFISPEVLGADIWLHHEPPVECGLSHAPDDENEMDYGSDDLYAALTPAWQARVRLVLSGHIHRAPQWQARCGNALCLNAATADFRLKAPKHVLIDLAAGTARLVEGEREERVRLPAWAP